MTLPGAPTAAPVSESEAGALFVTHAFETCVSLDLGCSDAWTGAEICTHLTVHRPECKPVRTTFTCVWLVVLDEQRERFVLTGNRPSVR